MQHPHPLKTMLNANRELERLRVSRLMDRTGIVLLVLSLFPLIDKGRSTGEPFSTAAAEVFDVVALWTCWILGMLLFLGRPLLRLRWWYAWVVFIAAGLIVLILVSDIRSVKPVLHVEMTAETGLVVAVAGVAGILMGFVFLVAQGLVRRL
jgi:hypothetical protein